MGWAQGPLACQPPVTTRQRCRWHLRRRSRVSRWCRAHPQLRRRVRGARRQKNAPRRALSLRRSRGRHTPRPRPRPRRRPPPLRLQSSPARGQTPRSRSSWRPVSVGGPQVLARGQVGHGLPMRMCACMCTRSRQATAARRTAVCKGVTAAGPHSGVGALTTLALALVKMRSTEVGVTPLLSSSPASRHSLAKLRPP